MRDIITGTYCTRALASLASLMPEVAEVYFGGIGIRKRFSKSYASCERARSACN